MKLSKKAIKMFFQITLLLLLMANAYGASLPDPAARPNINVHCDASQRDNCYIVEILDIHQPTDLQFIDADGWSYKERFYIPSGSNITVLPSGLFKRFTYTQEFELSTGLKTIGKDDFKDAGRLKRLDIHGNQLQTLPADVFEYVKQLKKIILSDNQLTTFEDNTFNGLEQLESIYLGNNSLTELKRNTFAGAPKISTLELQHNHIESIEIGAFNLRELQTVRLSNNRIQSLSDNVFRDARKLVMIDIASNGLKSIGKTFDDCKELTDLKLDFNQIVDLDLVALSKLPKILRLGLKNSGFHWENRLEWPTNPSTLEWLDISNNSLTGSNAITYLRQFSNLQGIYLEDNNLIDLIGFAEIKEDFPKLIEIGLNGNHIGCVKLSWIVDGLRAQQLKLIKTLNGDEDVKRYKGVTCVQKQDYVRVW